MKGLLAILGKPMMGKGATSDDSEEESEEEAPESSKDLSEYKSLIADSAKAGDWSAFADAVEGLVKGCK